MKKNISTLIALTFFILTATVTRAQMSAMDFAKNDCNGNSHHLFTDLDSGKAVLLHFYMPNCGMCPPSAKALQHMANRINAMHPGMVVGYAFPFNNTTTCTYSKSWTTSNSLSLYSPMDSGAAQVANYGGFGMPTVVLLGGMDHRVMYASQSVSISDTAAIRDSILSLMSSTHTGINTLPSSVATFSIFPNPATDAVSISLGLKESAMVSIEVLDITGKQVAVVLNEKLNAGTNSKKFNTTTLPNGNYLMRLNANGQTITHLLSIAH